jgi:serine/threonine-protein kinase
MVDDLLSFVDDEGFALDPAELAATVERLIRPGDVGDQDVLRDTLTPLAGEPEGPREPRPQATAGPDEQTPCLPLCEYRVRRGGGDEQGPMSYAELVERIMNGQVRPDDEVSMNRGPFRAVSATPDLQRHLPMLTPVTTRIDGPGVPDRQGLFAAESVSAVFLLLARHKESGLLVADSGAVRKEVYFADGHPIYASSNLASELLGEWLVARGVLSRMELDMALALLPRYEGHLGDTLVAMELVDPLTLFSHITEQVCHKILDLFKWRTGGWAFFRGVVCEKRAFPLSSSGPELLHEGIRRSLTAEEIDKWWSAMEPRALMPEEQPDPPVEWWPISDLERLALGAVDRPLPAVQAFRRLRERASMATRETLLRAFHFCVAAGLLRPAE